MGGEIKVGDTLWKFDINRRVYAEGRRGGPIYEEHFSSHQITRETPQSWIVEEYGRETRVNKKTLRSAGSGGFGGYQWFTDAGKDDDIWCYGKRTDIVRAVERADGTQLRAIADLLGLDR